jgi:uncharacterized membrane protein YGL010W
MSKNMKNLTKWEKMMVDYGFFHQDKRNLITHLIGVPIIVASFFVPFTWLSITNISVWGVLVPLNAALLLAIATALYYISLDRILGYLSIPFLVICVTIATQIGTLGYQKAGIIALVGFVGGFIFQFIGHAIEGKKPALIAYNPIVAMISSPLFVVAEYARPFGVHQSLWKKAEAVIQEMEAETVKKKQVVA